MDPSALHERRGRVAGLTAAGESAGGRAADGGDVAGDGLGGWPAARGEPVRGAVDDLKAGVATYNIEMAARCDLVIALRDGHLASDVAIAGTDPARLLDRIGQLRPDS
jgi:hypothetical protein